MSGAIATGLAERAREALLHTIWAQWGALNPRLLQQREPRARASVVDPEALVLASLALWDDERRLVDVLAWWAEQGSALMSVRRIESIRRDFPSGEAGSRIASFARWARDAGDTRWKQTEAGEEPGIAARSGKGPAQLELLGAESLLLKLRAGFGVSAKPDVFCYVLTLNGEGATSKDITRAVGYADKNVRRAAQELVLGGFLEQREGFPVEYAVRPGFAPSLLRLLSTASRPVDQVPRWVHWSGIYPFLLHVGSWADELTTATPYLLSSRARSLFADYRWAFRGAALALPDPARFPGERYLSAFSETLDLIVDWMGAEA